MCGLGSFTNTVWGCGWFYLICVVPGWFYLFCVGAWVVLSILCVAWVVLSILCEAWLVLSILCEAWLVLSILCGGLGDFTYCVEPGWFEWLRWWTFEHKSPLMRVHILVPTSSVKVSRHQPRVSAVSLLYLSSLSFLNKFDGHNS